MTLRTTWKTNSRTWLALSRFSTLRYLPAWWVACKKLSRGFASISKGIKRGEP